MADSVKGEDGTAILRDAGGSQLSRGADRERRTTGRARKEQSLPRRKALLYFSEERAPE